MSNSCEIVKKAFEHQSVDRLPRGEVWLGTDLLRKANLEDNLKGHLALIERLGQDILCLPISNDLSINKGLGYRYFNFKELEEASRMSDIFLVRINRWPLSEACGKKRIDENPKRMETGKV